MASRIRLVNITKLNKSSWLVQQESEVVLKKTRQSVDRQAEFINKVGMDRKALRDFINSDHWTAKQRHKARQELVRFNEDLKQDMADQASLRRKEIRVSRNLLMPKSKSKSSARRHRTGFV